MAHRSIADRIEALVQPIADDLGLELVEVQYQREGRGMVLRIFVDQDGGVTLDQCADLSRQASALFDVEDPIKGAYTLEVSSPGIERPLKKAADYKRFSGKLAKIKTHEKLDPDQRGTARKTFVGILKGCDEGQVSLNLEDREDVTIQLDLADIAGAHLEFRF